jgi:hypothetical protein
VVRGLRWGDVIAFSGSTCACGGYAMFTGGCWGLGYDGYSTSISASLLPGSGPSAAALLLWRPTEDRLELGLGGEEVLGEKGWEMTES